MPFKHLVLPEPEFAHAVPGSQLDVIFGDPGQGHALYRAPDTHDPAVDDGKSTFRVIGPYNGLQLEF